MKVFDRIEAVIGTDQPNKIDKLLSSIGLASQRNGNKIPLALVDKALAGRSIGERMMAKEALYHAGLIEG